MDSFEHYSTLSAMALKYEASFGSGGSMNANAVGRFNSGFSLTGGNTATNQARHQFTTGTPSTVIYGMALRFTSGYNTSQPFMYFLEGGSTHLELRFNSSNQIYITRNGTLLGINSTTMLDNVWYYVECKVTIHDTTGSVHFRIDEVDDLILTNQDTRNGGTGYVNSIQIGSSANLFSESYGVFFDDLVILDNTGSTNNDFIGDVHVGIAFPNANGNSSQFTGSDGNSTDNYLLVDETTPNGDTDYVQSNTVDNKDTYNVQDVSFTTGDIFGVQIVLEARKTDAGGRSIASISRLSSTEVDSSSKSLSLTYQYYMDIREEKPGGGAWTATDINDAEFGMKVTA